MDETAVLAGVLRKFFENDDPYTDVRGGSELILDGWVRLTEKEASLIEELLKQKQKRSLE